MRLAQAVPKTRGRPSSITKFRSLQPLLREQLMGNVKGKQAMSKAPKDRSNRVWTRLSVPLRERITGYCAASGIAERTVFEAALGQYIAGTSDMALVMRPIDRLGPALQRTHQTS